MIKEAVHINLVQRSQPSGIYKRKNGTLVKILLKKYNRKKILKHTFESCQHPVQRSHLKPNERKKWNVNNVSLKNTKKNKDFTKKPLKTFKILSKSSPKKLFETYKRKMEHLHPRSQVEIQKKKSKCNTSFFLKKTKILKLTYL